MKLLSLITATLLFSISSLFSQATASHIKLLMDATEERHDIVEELFATSYKMQNIYHGEVMSSNRYVRTGRADTSGYTKAFSDRLTRPVYNLKYTSLDYPGLPPQETWFYSDKAGLDRNTRIRANIIQEAEEELAEIQALEYDDSNDLSEESTYAFDNVLYHKLYYEWLSKGRKVLLEEGVESEEEFDTDRNNPLYFRIFPAHPDNARINREMLEEWTEQHEREVARKQRAVSVAYRIRFLSTLGPNGEPNHDNDPDDDDPDVGEIEREYNLSLIHISEPRDKRQSRMPSSA